MASTNSTRVWQWISGILVSALIAGTGVVWMLGTDAVGSTDFKALQTTVNQLVVAQAVTSTELIALRESLERRNTP